MNKITCRPDPKAAFPNPKIPSLCYIKNVVKNPRIIIGDYTYFFSRAMQFAMTSKRKKPTPTALRIANNRYICRTIL